MSGKRRKTPNWVYWCQYALLRGVIAVFEMFPPDWNVATARACGWFWFRVMKRHRERARENLRAAFGEEVSEARIMRTVRRSMQQMAMMVMELMLTPRRITEWNWPHHVRLRNLGPAVEVLLNGKGVILLTAHFGNWELLGYTLATLGFDINAVMRPLDNPYLNAYLERTRAKTGLKLIYKKGASAVADEILRSGAALCFIADQDAGRKGVFVDFFGRPASTYKSIGLLAMIHEVPVVVGYARRISAGFQYEIGVNRVIHPQEWQGRPDALKWLTREYSRAMEEFIRADPDQYLWVHRRWKTRPRQRSRRIASAVGAGRAQPT